MPFRQCVLLLFLLLGNSILFSASESFAQHYHIETIEESDGLPSPDIKSIAQDRLGLIWIASRSGLAYFSGETWHQVSVDSLVSNCSHALLQTTLDGQLWALISGSGSALIKKDLCLWTTIPLPAELSGKDITFTQFSLAEVGSETVAAIVVDHDSLFVKYGHQWHNIPLGNSGINTISDMIVNDNQFIMATDNGLFSLQPEAPFTINRMVKTQLTDPVLCLSLDKQNNRLWLVGGNWIGQLDDGNFTYLLPPQDSQFPSFLESPFPTCGADAFGGIYFSGHYGTQYFNPATGLEFLGPENGLSFTDTRIFFLDRENVVWQGTRRGISKIISRHTAGYTSQQGLLSDEVTAILRRRDGTLVMGHNDGLTLWNGEMTTIAFSNNDAHNRVLDLAEDSKGNIWIAGRQRGIGKLSPDGNLSWWSSPEFTRGFYLSVVVDDQDQVWAAMGNQLLMGTDGESFEPIQLHNDPLEKGYIRRLILGKDGTIYLATGNLGLFAYKDGQIRNWETGLKDHGNSVYDLLETPEGITWVGTRAGLYQLVNNRLRRPTEPQFDIKQPVYFLEKDESGRLWVGTDNGVIRINQDQVDHFSVENGLIGRETNRCASLTEPNGKIWVGTERGLTLLDDRFENTINLPPLIYIIEMETGNQTYSLMDMPEEIILPTRSETLVFKYRVLTSREPNRIETMSRLDGFNSEWFEQNPSNEFVMRYTNLDPGTYQFHIKASAWQQPWSDVKNSPRIIIPLPVWRQAWFLILVGLALLAVLIFPILVLAQRRYTARLEEEVKAQVEANLRIETELEQARNLRSLGVLAGGIAHDFNNLLTIIFGNLSLIEGNSALDKKQGKQLKTAIGAIERARGLTNQLLTFSRGGTPVLKVGSLADLVHESAAFVLRGSSTKCHFELAEDLWPVEMDAGQMSQVINNLLMNAQEAMPSGGHITLTGKNIIGSPDKLSPGKYVVITFTDNGPGIEPENLSRIFDPYFTTKNEGSGLGLATAYSILDRHNGKLTVESTVGEGTTMRLVIPASDFVSPQHIEDQNDETIPLHGMVLVMDDDAEVRQSFRIMLEKLGLEVEEAENGGQALNQYRKRLKEGTQYKLVIMDLTIPGDRGGKETIGPLLEIDPDAVAIVASGYSHDKVLAEHQEFGFKAALQKPVGIKDLTRVLHKVFAQKAP